MGVEIITKEDLQVFRRDLLNDIKQLLNQARPEVKEWLKASEVRKLLKISPNTLLTMRATGKLRYSKIGGTYYYKHEDIQKMLTNASGGHE